MSSDEYAVERNPNRRVWIGCSGFAYRHWRGVFYPDRLPTTKWLDYYAHFFPTVELNNTHYMMPGEKTFLGWRNNSPEGFVYAVKASRIITHMKKLREPEAALRLLFDRVALLGPKLGPLLYQLPPRWRFNAERLASFLKLLPADIQHTVEVRDPTWLNPDFFALLERYGVAYCVASLPLYQTPVLATARFVYIRFHGSRNIYYYNYGTEELSHWRDIILRFAGEGRTVYCYFNNDPEGWAVNNALELTRLVNDKQNIA